MPLLLSESRASARGRLHFTLPSLNTRASSEKHDGKDTKAVFLFLPLPLSSTPENIPRSCQPDPGLSGPQASIAVTAWDRDI